MLKLFRRKNLGVKILLFVIVFMVGGAMLVYLVPGAGGDPSLLDREGVLAQIGGRPVTITEVQRNFQRMASQMDTQSEQFRSLIMEQVVESSITRHAVAYEAERLGLQVTPEELGARLRQISTFYPGGEFVGVESYRQIVQRTFQMSVPEFEENLRQDILQAKLAQWVTAGLTVAPAEVEREYRQRNETVQVEFVLFQPRDYARRLQLGEEELRAYFEEHREQYLIPERRSVRLVAVDFDRLSARVRVTREELQDYYQRHRDSYYRPERVNVRHILFLKSQAHGEVASLRERAQAVLQQVRQGRDFAALAEAHSDDTATREGGGRIGWVRRGQTVSALEKVLFSLAPQAPPQLVETEYGFHIVDVLEHQPERVRPLEEVRDDIEPVVKEEKVRRLAREQAREIAAQVRAGQSLEEAAQAHGWQVRELPPFERNEAVGPFSPDSGLQEAAFRLPADRAGEPNAPVSDPVSLRPGFAVVQLREVRPTHPAEFQEVRAQVLETYREERGRQQAREAAQRLAEQAAGQNSLRQPAQQLGLAVEQTQLFTRQGFIPELGAARDIAPVAFNLSVGQVSPALPTGGDWVIFRVIGRQEADLDQLTPGEREALRESVLEQKRLLVWSVFQEDLKKRLRAEDKLQLNQQAIDRLVGRG